MFSLLSVFEMKKTLAFSYFILYYGHLKFSGCEIWLAAVGKDIGNSNMNGEKGDSLNQWGILPSLYEKLHPRIVQMTVAHRILTLCNVTTVTDGFWLCVFVFIASIIMLFDYYYECTKRCLISNYIVANCWIAFRELITDWS